MPQFIPHLARAGAAVGVDGFFFEVHDNPAKALSDGANALEPENVSAAGGRHSQDTQFASEDLVSTSRFSCIADNGDPRFGSGSGRDPKPRGPHGRILSARRRSCGCVQRKDRRHGTGQIRDHLQKNCGDSQQHGFAGDFPACGRCASWRLRIAGPDDMVLAVSKSGETAEILQILNVAKRLGLAGHCDGGRPGFHACAICGCFSRCQRGGRSLSSRPGADDQHRGGAGDGRCAGDGPDGEKGIRQGGLCIAFTRPEASAKSFCASAN